ncbi:MAG: prolyl-tRNA synthetase [Candidatus Vogelbacteria bacterium RIFOXYD1_FULL_46_19]|uniref:Proline--tRNA ligase n=1 Tax=Candidatus Vogelbacteria bacterium RIFOXYD1_FULL_46_19 TaxID=1802439 RepID=A0A1G2QHP3_9BACT|nr:MAG: prolyl-tRNA synthetase [Candidatus Vogelbacteria bacterium RIFOXYD1_FULL_46_19]
MRQSQLFARTRWEDPTEETAKNAKLLIRAGLVHKEMAGVYAFLPLGLRVLRKIETVIREEMNAIGGQEVLMTTLQNPEIWHKTGRFDDAVVDNWFKTKLVSGGELGIANTHEEPITAMLVHHLKSYKDLPVYVYQFQTKFRNELRAKSGIMRGREFLMKDLYSFSRTEVEFHTFYEQCAAAYLRIFARVGLGDHTFRTLAAGGSFTTGLTDEFQTLSEAGEDIIYIDRSKHLAVNKEVLTDENLARLGLERANLEEAKSIEVGNIFPLGHRYSDALGLKYRDESGLDQPIYMGSYGIGLSRLLGTIVEVLADDGGIVWPASVAPFAVHLVALGSSEPVRQAADQIYADLSQAGVEALFDDRDLPAGEKLGDADLLGMPLRVIVSEKTLAAGKLEVKNRQTAEIRHLTFAELITEFK